MLAKEVLLETRLACGGVGTIRAGEGLLPRVDSHMAGKV